jgi:hypothetical protein
VIEPVDLGLTLATSYSAATGTPTLDFLVGQVTAWNSTTATNSVLVRGVTLNNLPVLTSAGSVGLEAGVNVGLLKVRTQYFILGRIVDQSTGLVNPQFPIVLYPQFQTKRPADALGYWYVSSTVLNASWEGRIKVSFPYVAIDGVWGTTGTSATYQLKLAGNVVGQWTHTAIGAFTYGPFDVRDYLGLDWVRIEVVYTSAVGVGDVAIQTLGCYFRDSL